VLGLLSSGRGRLLNSGGLLSCLGLILLLDDVAEDVVQDKVAVGLGGENESLGELLVRGRLVGDLANDLDDNVVIRGLGIDVGDADLALGEVELLDALVDGLFARLALNGLLRSGASKKHTRCPTQTSTFSVSLPETNCERLL
jgi:hypothetical protein